jgi:hypothetical protein
VGRIAASDFRSRDSARCIEDVRENATLRTLTLVQSGQVCRFLKEKAGERNARYAQYSLAQSLLKEKRNKKGNKGKSGQAQRLW